MRQSTALAFVATCLIAGGVPAIAPSPAQQAPPPQRPLYHGQAARVSPDGKHVLFARDSAAGVVPFIMNADGSDERPLPDPAARSASWMSDSKHLLVGIPDGAGVRPAIANLDGSIVREIPMGNTKAVGTPILIGGKTILFPSPVQDSAGRKASDGMMRDGAGNRVSVSFYLMDIDGQNLRPLVVPAVPGRRVGQLAPSHDGSRFAFTVVDTTAPESGTLYVVNLDGSGLRKVATLPDFVEQPAWSHDDRRIVLVDDGHVPSFRITPGYVSDASLVVVDVETGAMRPVAHFDRRYVDEVPCWSSDGRIYFQSDRDGRMEIYRMNADGSNRERLTR